MKVLHLIGSVGVGGAEMLFFDLVQMANENSQGNLYFAFYNEGILSKKLTLFNSVYDLRSKNKILLILKIRQLILENELDIIHSHTPYGIFYAYLASLGTRAKLILTVHGSRNSMKSKIVYNTAFILCQKLLFVSQSFKKRLLMFLRKKEKNNVFGTLYNGINKRKIPSFKKESFSNLEHLKLGMIGNFYNNGRDQLTVCEAAKLMHQKGLQFNLDFVGGADGKKKPYLNICTEFVFTNELAGCISFVGFQNNALSLLREWDAFVYSSNRDTFGIAVVEAMMAGIPVIVNDLDVFVEITENGKHATLYKTKDPEDLARKIEAYIIDPTPFHEKAQKAAIYAREKFSIEKHYNSLIEIYKTLLQS